MENSTVILIVVVAIVFFLIVVYNQFISFRNRAKNAFANIDVMLKKRYDLIPQIVESVKGIMKHERETLEQITSLRQQVDVSKLSQDEILLLNNQLSDKMGQIFIAVEAYPELKSSGNFLHLQRTMVEIEEQLSASRRSYNMSVTDFNTLLEKFPSNIVGNIFNFKRKVLFEATATEKSVMNVNQALKN
jgi:LemA protein